MILGRKTRLCARACALGGVGGVSVWGVDYNYVAWSQDKGYSSKKWNLHFLIIIYKTSKMVNHLLAHTRRPTK